jgi:tetraacyldisaccharide 4'-kinase
MRARPIDAYTLNPLSTIYGSMVRVRNSLYDGGVLPVRRLEGAVVSVGNLSSGGSGKTPFILLLGGLLKARSITFDVLSRGYGRSSRGVLLVDPAGLPQQFGDEPLLIARKLQAPVIVGEDRYAAGRFAESKFGPQLHLLDDGFQHRALARDFDIVLVTPQDVSDRLLPVGRLREPIAALDRADAIALTSGAQPASFAIEGQPVWRVRRGITLENIPPRPLLFCGIARPQNFALQLHAAGIEPVAEARYRDHHAYDEKDVRELLALKQKSQAGGFVTTEKDAVNLGPYIASLEPLAVVPVKMELSDAANAVDTILRKIEERRRCT